jgi:hypothetical protein
MNMVSWPLAKDTDPGSAQRQGPGPIRTRSEVEREERANQRRHELAVQRSELNPPDVRIRVWEKLHGLRLPSDLAHPILGVIAVGTRLTLAEVQAEQCARASRCTARVETETETETEKSGDSLSTSDRSATHRIG